MCGSGNTRRRRTWVVGGQRNLCESLGKYTVNSREHCPCALSVGTRGIQ